MRFTAICVAALGVATVAGLSSCGPNDGTAAQPGQTRAKTLAGTADVSKNNNASAAQGREVRIPNAPIERPTPNAAATSGVAASPAGTPAAIAGPQRQTAAAQQSPAAAAAQAQQPSNMSDMPLAPKDAQWTIYCATISDADHMKTSRDLRTALVQRTGLREWYLLHDDAHSRLYYGFYRSIADKGDAAESARAQADRKKIDELADGRNERPFKNCQFVQLSAPDPDAPPQWNIVNVPPDKTWTLIVGAYKDSPERKKLAVEAVREAREKYGEEAYYYHGDSVSNVCIGTWPDTAVLEERLDPDPKASRNGAGDVLVLPQGIKPTAGVKTKEGRNVRAVSVNYVPVDEGLKKMIAKYPYMGVNGELLIIKGGGKQHYQPAMVAQIPRAGDSLNNERLAAGAGQQQGAADGRGLDQQDPFNRPGVVDNGASKSAPPPPAPRPASGGNTGNGGGRLRSIDNR
jgi:hypothetical protein